MAKAAHRISVVRISRKIGNQADPNEFQDDTDKDASISYLPAQNPPRTDKRSSINKEQNDTSRTKTELFTPRASDLKNDDPNQQNDGFDLPRSSFAIQHQPERVDTWVKHSPDHPNQPHLSWEATGRWSNGLCSLFDDFNMFCYACACWCCFRHEISTMMNEHWLLWFVNCTPLMELRTKFRQQYGIQVKFLFDELRAESSFQDISGSIAEDFCLSTCCPLCVALQLANEGRHYGHRIFC